MSSNGSQLRWRAVRRYLNSSRAALTRTAAGLAEEWPRTGPSLITPDGWVAARPVPLEEVRLSWDGAPAAPRVTGAEPQAFLVRPLQDDGQRYPSYSAALGAVDPPGIFDNRPCYRLLSVSGDPAALSFGPADYFDGIDVAEAVAHELAAVWMASGDLGGRKDLSRTDLPLRTLAGEPGDLAGRTVVPAVCTLTVRHDTDADSAADAASFLLHWRDPKRVASGGGLYQVAPVGVFQPAGSVGAGDADFDLWRCISRELSEELLGTPEHHGLDYAEWPFGLQLEEAREKGRCKAYYLGAGVDPLTLVVDLMTVVVFEAATYDEIFADLVSGNDEGTLTGGAPFTEETVTRYARDEPMQPAGAALLELAWRHREMLLG
jgi:hypothetical protein